MLLAAWMLVSLALIIAGLITWEPWWVRTAIDAVLLHPKTYCKRCHHDITVGDKFRADFNAVNELDGRQV